MSEPGPAEYVRPKDIDNRATFWQRIQWRLETIAWDVIYWAPMKALGPDRASDFGGWLVKKIGPLLSQQKTMRRNLRLAFPDWTDAQIEETALAAWESVGRTAGEICAARVGRGRARLPVRRRSGIRCDQSGKAGPEIRIHQAHRHGAPGHRL